MNGARMGHSITIPRLLVAGTGSGVGKTTVAVGLIRALRQRGLRIAVFKCGPDYLDPTYLSRAAGLSAQNLDGWMMGRDAVLATFVRASRGADLAVIEGVMGLFDGASPTGEEGSTAEIAKWLDAPVLLVLDAGGMARSAAAMVHGFAAFDADLRVSGIVCNRVGSAGHLELLRKAVRHPRIVGGLPKKPEHAFKERHLGLHTAERQVVPEQVIDAWGEHVAKGFDLEEVIRLARSALPFSYEESVDVRAVGGRCRIGVAFDEAFHFYYEDNFRRLEQAGAELVRFSPLHDPGLPDVHGLYFGGGYPEVHAEGLAANEGMRAAIVAFAAGDGPVYAECGGLMYLSTGVRTLDGSLHPMVGLIPGEAQLCAGLVALGYVEVETRTRSVLGPAGLRFRGHQFRYSELRGVPETVARTYTVRRRRGGEAAREGYRTGSVLASYVHGHWASNPRIAEGFVKVCDDYRRRST